MIIRRLNFLLPVIISLLLNTTLVAAHSASQSILYKVTPRLREKLERDEESDELLNVWVFFEDKGELSGSRLLMSGREPLVSWRSLRRRELRGNGDLDYFDLPVCRDYVERVRRYTERIRHCSRYLNGVSATVEPERINEISSLPFVRSLDLVNSSRVPFDYRLYDQVDRTESSGQGYYEGGLINYGGSAYQLEQVGLVPLLNAGYNGSRSKVFEEPVRIAILDTGFRRDHSALKDVKVVAEWDFVNNDPITRNEDGDPFFQDYHGTLVLGTIAGHADGELIGPAWGAEYLLAKTEIVDTEIVFEEDNWIAGIEWADSAGADIVTSSLGYIDWYARDDLDGNTARCTIAADIAVSHGMVVVNSAGNSGSDGLIAPADGDSVIAVGAVERGGAIADFSSRGPTADGRIKPDLVAMGVNVYTVSVSDTAGYSYANGTSFSAPLIAGGCAVLLEIHPDWSPIKVMEALESTASRAYRPDNTYGWGIPDFSLASELQLPGYSRGILVEGPMPNPFSASASFALFLPVASPLKVVVYDARGERVKRVYCGSAGKLWNEFIWDGTNDRGKRVAPGVYFIDVVTPGYRRVIKSVLLY